MYVWGFFSTNCSSSSCFLFIFTSLLFFSLLFFSCFTSSGHSPLLNFSSSLSFSNAECTSYSLFKEKLKVNFYVLWSIGSISLLTSEGVTQINLWLIWISAVKQLCISWWDHQFSSQVILTALVQMTPDMHSKILLWCFSWLKKIWLYETKSSSPFKGLWWVRKHEFYCLFKFGILVSKCLVCLICRIKWKNSKCASWCTVWTWSGFFFCEVMAKIARLIPSHEYEQNEWYLCLFCCSCSELGFCWNFLVPECSFRWSFWYYMDLSLKVPGCDVYKINEGLPSTAVVQISCTTGVTGQCEL